MRHFRKNIGRKVEIETDEETFIDTITEVAGDSISFEAHNAVNLVAVKNAILQIAFKKLESDED
jgi:ribosome maturation factor RimP